jgi:hypothetical protein
LLDLTCRLYKQQNPEITAEVIIANLKKTEPFKSNYKMTEELLVSEFPEVSM